MDCLLIRAIPIAAQGMCNQFSCLECAVALARLTGRTLVLPRWRPQYGFAWMGDTSEYFDVEALAPRSRVDMASIWRRSVSVAASMWSCCG